VLIACNLIGELKFYQFSSYQDGIYGQPVSFAHAEAHFAANGMMLLVCMGLILLIVAWKDLEG
jgi:hypothetical protein